MGHNYIIIRISSFFILTTHLIFEYWIARFGCIRMLRECHSTRQYWLETFNHPILFIIE